METIDREVPQVEICSQIWNNFLIEISTTRILCTNSKCKIAIGENENYVKIKPNGNVYEVKCERRARKCTCLKESGKMGKIKNMHVKTPRIWQCNIDHSRILSLKDHYLISASLALLWNFSIEFKENEVFDRVLCPWNVHFQCISMELLLILPKWYGQACLFSLMLLVRIV